MECKTCGQVVPDVKRGDIVEFVSNPRFLGVVYQIEKAHARVTLLNAGFAGWTREWPLGVCRVVHGHIHVDRVAK